MKDIVMLTNVKEQDQNDFIISKYPQFVANSLYGYLFQGLDLRRIEEVYLDVGNDDFCGFFAKGVLNKMGVCTSKKSGNRGKYAGEDLSKVILKLKASEDACLNNIGTVLSQKK